MMGSDETLLRIELAGLSDTDRLGRWLAAHLPGGTCVGLVGTLGAGKTRLAQAIIAAHGVDRQSVTSPTFALLRSYPATPRTAVSGAGASPEAPETLHHLDAYRLADEDEFLELGVEDLLEDDAALTMIEWARRVEHCLPRSTLWVEIEWTPSERRTVTFRGPHETWGATLATLAAEFPAG